MKILFLFSTLLIISAPGICSETFKDVPEDHWAAEAVEQLADAKVLTGYPDGTYRGDQPVTRYELAVALAAFVQYIEHSREPLVCKPEEGNAKSSHWAEASLSFLKTERMLPTDSPILQGGDDTVTVSELADALVAAAARIVEMAVPPTNPES